MIAIINTGVANLRSVANAVERLDQPYELTTDADVAHQVVIDQPVEAAGKHLQWRGEEHRVDDAAGGQHAPGQKGQPAGKALAVGGGVRWGGIHGKGG